ncbi:NADPH-dependent F420 reductase [Brevibacterium pityocampae]|uniref:NAD(P)-binding domain-containing protein n=1 Tax=Brevibacterium pityocampae TaxID=506594 RepID=A0ABP8J870_9MICO
MTVLGIIGSGAIGTAIARLAVAAGIDVVLSNSRGPETLDELIAELGDGASAGTPAEAAAAGDIVVVSVPLTAVDDLPVDALAGKTVLDTTNYYPFRDGRISVLDDEEVTEGEYVQARLGTARVVKAFSSILAHHIPQLARPAGASDRTALPIAGDDPAAKEQAAALIEQIGFDVVDAGPLSEAWRFEPESTAYTRLYLADPDTPGERMLEALAGPVPAAELSAALAAVHRVRVADREF